MPIVTTMNEQIKKIIAHFGGQSKAAKALGVSQPTVHGWLMGRHGISPLLALRIERLTGGRFPAVGLCPALAA